PCRPYPPQCDFAFGDDEGLLEGRRVRVRTDQLRYAFDLGRERGMLARDGGQPMSECVLTCATLSGLGSGPSALLPVAALAFDFLSGHHVITARELVERTAARGIVRCGSSSFDVGSSRLRV